MPEPSGTNRSARISWARLLARIYEVLPLLCPAWPLPDPDVDPSPPGDWDA